MNITSKSQKPKRRFDQKKQQNTFNPFTPKSAKLKTEGKFLNFILQNCQKQTASHESTSQ